MSPKKKRSKKATEHSTIPQAQGRHPNPPIERYNHPQPVSKRISFGLPTNPYATSKPKTKVPAINQVPNSGGESTISPPADHNKLEGSGSPSCASQWTIPHNKEMIKILSRQYDPSLKLFFAQQTVYQYFLLHTKKSQQLEAIKSYQQEIIPNWCTGTCTNAKCPQPTSQANCLLVIPMVTQSFLRRSQLQSK